MTPVKSHIFCLIVFLSSILNGQSSDRIPVSYKFRFGDILTYQIEQQDSVEITSQGKSLKDNTHLRLNTTVTVTETPPENPYTVQVKTDTADVIHPSNFRPNLIEKEINQILHKAQEGEFKFDSFGHFEKNKSLHIPVIFPLNKESVQINDIWHYKLQNNYNENGRYESASEVKCLVYDIVEKQNSMIAILLLNVQSKIEGHFKRKEIHLRLSGDYTISTLATNIVYFNINAGHVERIISENQIQWEVKSKAADILKMIKRKSTIQYVESADMK